MDKDYKLKAKPLDQITLADFDMLRSERRVNFWVPEYSQMYLMHSVVRATSQNETPLLIDVGFGSGLCSRLFSDIGFDVLAVDTNKELVKQAKEVYGQKGIEFVEGGVEDLKSIVEVQQLKDVDTVYCSFMPEGVNWTPTLRNLRPGVIFHVLEKYGDRWATGTAEAYKPGENYEAYGFLPLVSYRDLGTLDSQSLETASTWLAMHVRKDLLQMLLKKHGPIRELIAKSVTQSKYRWEVELDIEIEKAKSQHR